MNDKEKARPDAATSEQAKEKSGAQPSFSPSDSITGREERQAGFVESFLLHGAENALPSKALVELAGLRNTRELQRLIQYERLNGALILSRDGNGGGYFLPDEGEKGVQEIEEFVKTNRSRALSTLQSIRTASHILKNNESEKV